MPKSPIKSKVKPICYYKLKLFYFVRKYLLFDLFYPLITVKLGAHNEFGPVHNNHSQLLENQITLVRNFQRMLRETQTNTSNYLIKQLPRPTAFIDKDFRIIHASDKWIEYFDFNTDRVIGETIHKLFGKVDPHWQEALKGLSSRQTKRCTYRALFR